MRNPQLSSIFGLLASVAVVSSLLAGGSPPANAQQWGASEQRIRCESYGAGEQFCRAPNDGRVRLVRNLGPVYCNEGRNWRSDRNGITVREGCRGEFALMGTPPSGWNDQGSGEIEMRCDSDDGREAFCAINNRGIRLTRTLSRAPCVEGNTWRADSRGIYVRGGCRGQFVARTGNDGGWSGGGGGWGNNNSGGGWGNNNSGGGWGNNNNGGYNPGSAPYQIRCQSIGGRWGACPVQINGKVRLVRRESHAACTRGMTWGTLGNEAIWVSDGCRAIFEVQGGRPMAGRSNYDGAGMAPPGVSRMAIPEDSDGPPMRGPDPQGPGVSRDAPK
jgi:hypothetical protein